MKISVFGAGYVGLVLSACLADVGNDVLCVDVNAERVARLKNGECPIHEAGLADLLLKVKHSGHLHFTDSAAEAVNHGETLFLAVSTPSDVDGSADLRYVLTVAQSIGEHMQSYKLVVNKSTVPIGTAEKVRAAIKQAKAKRGVSIEFDVASNPEFLKEGAALEDFQYPDRIVVGADSDRAIKLLHQVYRPFCRKRDVMITMDICSAELTKYVSNAMLATKISFMNEMSNIAELVGADIERVREAVGADSRVGYAFIFPGCGFGGSCFPKDLRALEFTSKSFGYMPRILKAVQDVNVDQKQVLLRKVRAHFKDQLQGKKFAVWGLSFKPKTDDIREASSCDLIEGLLKLGASVCAYDPEAMPNFKKEYAQEKNLSFAESPEEVLDGAEALILVTEWTEFRSPSFEFLKEKLKAPVIFDGRNVFDPAIMKDFGFSYYSIGRQGMLV